MFEFFVRESAQGLQSEQAKRREQFLQPLILSILKLAAFSLIALMASEKGCLFRFARTLFLAKGQAITFPFEVITPL